MDRIAPFQDQPRGPRAEVLVRWAGPTHAHAIARIDAVASGCDIDSIVPLIRKDLHRDGTQPLVALAVVRGLVVGYAKLYFGPFANGWPAGAWFTGLTVDPAWRRRGVGEALTAARLERADADGPVTAFYFTTADNRASIALHEALGFVAKGPIDTDKGRRLLFQR